MGGVLNGIIYRATGSLWEVWIRWELSQKAFWRTQPPKVYGESHLWQKSTLVCPCGSPFYGTIQDRYICDWLDTLIPILNLYIL